MTSRPAPADVLARARAGDIGGAIVVGEAIFADGGGDPGLRMFVGMLYCRRGDPEQGVHHLRQAVSAAPGEPAARIELARALLALGADREAEEIAVGTIGAGTSVSREMQRIRAHALLRLGRAGEAKTLYEELVNADPRDFESLTGVGASLLAQGLPREASEALRRALAVKPSTVTALIYLARAQTTAGDHAEGLASAKVALDHAPLDPRAHLEQARALAFLNRPVEALASLDRTRRLQPPTAQLLSDIADVQVSAQAFDQADTTYREALGLQSDCEPAWLGLCRLAERTNRLDQLETLLDQAVAAGVPADRTVLLRAKGLRGRGLWKEALELARAAPTDTEPTQRAQLIGDLADKLGDSALAFDSFTAANAVLAASVGDENRSENYLSAIRQIRSLISADWYAGWSSVSLPKDRRSPLFIFGFPRSGTTLIDTMLAGHPDAVVLEEQAIIQRTSDQLGPFEKLADMDRMEVERTREFYFNEVDRRAPGAADKLLVDKDPLGLIGTPMLHRMFPDARFVFAERHPCDVVLSCLMTSSVMNLNVAHFFDLRSTARLYDEVLSYWERCREVMPLNVHTVRYERLVVETEDELRRLADFAGLSWMPKLAASQTIAKERGFIASPSYAQVAEPIYTRASGRWLRYKAQMSEVLPILEPWIRKLGYDPGPIS